MPIVITKGKPKTKPVSALVVADNTVETLEPGKLSDEELVDQYGKLQDMLLALQANPVFAQFEMVETELKSRLEKFEPDEIIAVVGKDYELEAGACKLAPRKITNPLMVLEWIGPEAFSKIAKVGVSDAEKYLVPDQFEQVVSPSEFTKNRAIKVKYLGGNKKAK